ncbi:MAG: 1-deoxy-D-xylulose-5-phosphate synthase [Clostridiales bacterium]|nr:1-deoxy-D-xylulose-5-phosphate synthase [Clostridiales bacterium]
MDARIEQIHSPSDLKRLSRRELSEYCVALRTCIIETVTQTGGHLASALGAVELAVALHYVFDAPKDKILWDVGHQAYVHKLITGRADRFASLRTNGGISGFPKMSESEYDAFTMGHASTSLSVGLGYVRARDRLKQDYQVVSVIGDGALTGGMAFEALNDIGAYGAKMLIVLNDNKMSISQNVGAMSKYLNKLRVSKRYSKLKSTVKKGVLGIPLFGQNIYKALGKTKDGLRAVLQQNKMFEQMGIRYFGPIDGHDLSDLISTLSRIKEETGPVLLHIVTEKGKGDPNAQSDPSHFHGVSPSSAAQENTFSSVVSDFLCQEAEKDERITAITAAMAYGTGLDKFSERFPDRFCDVGIAEEHAVTLSAAMAAGGLKPYFAVYSTFLQRGFDQILHDVCINKLPVTFLIDRAGAVGSDGVTHQGIYDLSYLLPIPNMTVLTPKDGNELRGMLEFSLTFNGPLAIRYPKSYTDNAPCSLIDYGKWEKVRNEKSSVTILAAGNRALQAAMGTKGASIVNARFIKPLDAEMLSSLNKENTLLITVEDNALCGGFGEAVLSYVSHSTKIGAKVQRIGYEDAFLDNYSVSDSLQAAGITTQNLQSIIDSFTAKE